MVDIMNLKYFTFYLQGLPYHPRNVVVVIQLNFISYYIIGMNYC